MSKLSVNVNKIATLRNSRGGNVPNVEQCSRDLLKFGAHGITVHPRPDGRHIRIPDVHALRTVTREFGVEFNVEGYPSQDFLALIEKVRPEQCTLVPDPPHVLTSNAGWRVAENRAFLADVLGRLRAWGVRSSLFIDVFAWDDREQSTLEGLKPDRVELYTERYAQHFGTPEQAAITQKYREVADRITAAGIGLNAGHDLNLQNIRYLLQSIPQIEEVSIGHALIAESLYMGFEEVIRCYLTEMAL